MIGTENQRLMIELLEQLHLTDDDGNDGMGGAELLDLLIKEEKRVFLKENALQAVKKKTAVERQQESKQQRGRPSKVQVILCAWHHPETTQKRVVLGRAPNLSTLFTAARETLFIKRPKAAFVLETGFYLSDTMTVEEDTVICVTTKVPEVPGVTVSAAGVGPVVPLTAAEKAARKEELQAAKAAEAEAEMQKLEEIKEVYRVRASKRSSAGQRRQARSPAELQAHSRMLQQRLLKTQETSAYRAMLRQREGLPIWSKRAEIVRLIDEHSVVVLSGATGSGKSTQVPQFLLDHYIENSKGSEVNILVTQPRRISAISLCERVAAERCEEVGQTVGYSIRLDSCISGATALTFVTTGLLLRRLQEDPELLGVSHVVVDEVHERDIHSDFLLIILQELLERRRDLKLILMSATLQADLFQKYFGNCPAIHVPGRTFPVRHIFLEDIEARVASFKPVPGAGPAGRGGGGGGGGGYNKNKKKPFGPGGGGGKGKDGGGGNGGRESPPLISPKAEEPIDYPLITTLLAHLVSLGEADDSGVGGAILVFFPGFQEINELCKAMAAHPVLGNPRRVQAFPLHSSLPSEAQRAVFRRMPKGIKKIVVATNIAETSITIDDISYVVDSGRVKEMRYDAETHMSSLVSVWTSQAAASQRAGRAGRVREGDCFRLYTRSFMEEQMPTYTLPEMLRTPLEELSLSILALELGSPAEFLARAIEPPPPEAISTAVKNLKEIDALRRQKDAETKEVSYYLTPLGFHLANLPCDARIGKMLIIGSILGCLEPILTIAACLSYKSPFSNPFGLQQEADRAHAKYGSAFSDHIAALEAFNGWAALRNQPYRVRKDYCQENFLGIATLEQIDALRKELRRQLVDIGFAARGSSGDGGWRRRLQGGGGHGGGRGGGGGDAVHFGDDDNDYVQEEDDYDDVMEDGKTAAADVNLIRCCLLAALYPQVGVLKRPQKPGESAMFELKDKTKVAVHPGSINFLRLQNLAPHGKDAYLLYHKKVQSTKIYAYDSSFVSPFTILLFGGDIKIQWEHGSLEGDRSIAVTMDKWLSFRMTESSAVLVKYIRHELNQLLLEKFSDPARAMEPQRQVHARAIVETIKKLLVSDRNSLGI